MRRFSSSQSLSFKPAKMVVHSAILARPMRRSAPAKLIAVTLGAGLLLLLAHLLLRWPGERTYGLMIDAGSTGSRMHTFAFRRGEGGALKLISEDFAAVKPGLSAYKDDPARAADSLAPLLDRSRQLVPAAQRAATPVFLRATAGLRMAGAEKAEAILDAVRARLGASGFRFAAPGGAAILGGGDEGVYSWITVNYLLGRAGASTVGTLELGGGSAQVAFVPGTSPLGNKCDAATQTQLFGGKKLALYTKSDLGFGLQKARATALAHFESSNLLSSNPCTNTGPQIEVKIPFDPADRVISLDGAGDFTQCRAALERAVVEPARNACSCAACGYAGAPRPEPIEEYVAIAFYRERTAAIGMADSVTVKDIAVKGEKICKMSSEAVLAKYPKVPNGVATDLCLDLAYIVTHLEHGYGITQHSGTVLHVKETIAGYELGWSLGAMFNELTKLDRPKSR